jgi:hypothetical protein
LDGFGVSTSEVFGIEKVWKIDSWEGYNDSKILNALEWTGILEVDRISKLDCGTAVDFLRHRRALREGSVDVADGDFLID